VCGGSSPLRQIQIRVAGRNSYRIAGKEGLDGGNRTRARRCARHRGDQVYSGALPQRFLSGEEEDSVLFYGDADRSAVLVQTARSLQRRVEEIARVELAVSK